MTEQRSHNLVRQAGAEFGGCRYSGFEPRTLHHFSNDETGYGLRCSATAERSECFKRRDLFAECCGLTFGIAARRKQRLFARLEQGPQLFTFPIKRKPKEQQR